MKKYNLSNQLKFTSLVIAVALSNSALAQQQNSIATRVELGAILTSGNTKDENIKYNISVDWLRANWDYRFSTEGFRSSKQNTLAAQRLYHVARGRRRLTEDTFWEARSSYEDDRFSGYDYQADVTVSYGRSFLRNTSNMQLSANIGLGSRKSESEGASLTEAIARIAVDYKWDISETASFIQYVSFEPSEKTNINIFRSESAIESEIFRNLSLRFSVKVKHQTAVPVNRHKTDTTSAFTLVLNF